MMRSTEPSTLTDLLLRGSDSAPAVGTVDGRVATYAELRAHVTAAADALRSLGLGPQDTAAIVLPNGPEMATAFLATATAGTSAPLNPGYTRAEYDFYLDDLGARLVLVAEHLDSPVRDSARARGIRVVEVGSATGAAGCFTLGGRLPSGTATGTAQPAATALILHTSGTTSRPKMVPLTHANLTASARHIAATLSLTPGDRCLNVMPLFHIHGLVAALLASLVAGASVVCTPGFLSPRILEWLAECEPTWYTAVPTMHQAILARIRAQGGAETLRRSRLRFVRSSSAALPPRTLQELEAALGVPVIEAYGMTEASHQMSSNPLPPGERRPGTVGRAAGPEIAVVDAAGELLPSYQAGEVVIKGPNVIASYRNNEAADRKAFTGGWFRTGDEGFLSADGYLTLTGRIKEQINRGGEKISPLEVDGVLMDHPSVAQAVTFGVAHPLLGEEIAAAVVLKPGNPPGERELREYVATRLAYFKVPRQIAIVEAIPVGPTGKMQRIGLAERLGVTPQIPVDDDDLTPPRSPTEEIVAMAWAEIMGVRAPGIRRNFFALGGDSILATRLVARLRDLLALDIQLLDFFDAPSVAGIAAAVDRQLRLEEPATGPRPPS